MSVVEGNCNPSSADPDLEAALLKGGDIGRRLRSCAKSRLGPPITWSPVLRQMISLIMESHVPQILLWGVDNIAAYNRGYAKILDGQHPRVLGQCFFDFYPELAPQYGALCAAIRDSGKTQSFDNQPVRYVHDGHLQEQFVRMSFQPVREAGEVAGVLAMAIVTTREVLNERRIATLQRVSLACANAKDAAEVAHFASNGLRLNHCDLPAALIYLAEPSTHCVASHGLVSACRDRVAADAQVWNFAAIRENPEGVVIDALPANLQLIEPLPESTRPGARAFALPLRGRSGQLRGQFVVVLSTLRPFDDDYRNFLELLAEHIGAAMERAEALRETRRHAAELAALDRAKTTFFSNISHEFRTPLTLLSNPVRDALREGRTMAVDEMRLVDRNAQRLLKLVNSLLDFARVEAGRAVATPVPTDLTALTSEVASAFRGVAQAAGVEFIVDCAPLDLVAAVDRDMWEKIVLNLLSNAFKHTQSGRIEVILRSQPHGIVLQVRDTGVGISQAHLPRIFERFVRFEEDGHKRDGSGIGLTLTRELCRLHGGDVHVVSKQGVGSTFIVTLPAQGVCAATTATALLAHTAPFVAEAMRFLEPPAPLPSAKVGSDEPHLLIVDDNADMRGYLQSVLQTRWKVELASNGHEALRRIALKQPDLILSDVMMPEIDGLALLRELRSSPETRTIPIILLSARAGEEATLQGLHGGADDYVAKPFSAPELVARVQTHLKLAKARRDAAEKERQLKELARAKAWSEMLLDSAPNPLYLLDPKTGLVVFANRAARRLNIDPQRVAAMPKAGQTNVNGHALLVCTEHISAAYGQPAQIALALQDVTTLRHVETQLRAALAARDEFVSVAMHELRTPLAPILLKVCSLQRQLKNVVDPQVLSAIGDIGDRTRILDLLICDLLDMTRLLEGESVHLRRERFSMQQLVAQQIECLRRSEVATQWGCEVRLHSDTDTLGEWDRECIAKAVRHLLVNAVKFGEGRTVEVTLRDYADGIALHVRDYGIGIREADQKRIFNRLERAVSDRKYGGLGIGLWIAKRMVEAHAGSLSVRSTVGRGSTFTVWLPASNEIYGLSSTCAAS